MVKTFACKLNEVFSFTFTNLNEEKFYYQGEKKIKNLKPYNSSLVNLENVDSICKIIQSNHEFKKMKSEIL